jgi:hypothetical protein
MSPKEEIEGIEATNIKSNTVLATNHSKTLFSFQHPTYPNLPPVVTQYSKRGNRRIREGIVEMEIRIASALGPYARKPCSWGTSWVAKRRIST